MTSSKYNQYLDKFILQINTNEFYAAHESLEAIWFPRRFEDCDEMKLIKGFINAAVSFELIKKGRLKASQKVWKNYLKYKELIHEIDSPYLKKYHLISKHIQNIKSEN